MKQFHSNCLSDNEAAALINIPKSAHEDLVWSLANNHHFRVCSFNPIDASSPFNATIPGVTVELKYKLPKRIKSSGKLAITLHKTVKSVKYRAYQLETAPENEQTSYNDEGKVFGTHEHIGQQVNKIKPKFATDDLPHWFFNFCDKVNLTFTGTLPSALDRDELQLVP